MKVSEVSRELAQRIVEGIKTASGANANFICEGGIIAASYDPARVGTVHEGGKRIMDGELDEIAISAESAAGMKGTRPGYNGVVRIGGRRVAVIGISGDPDWARPIQRMAELVVREELRRSLDLESERVLVKEMESKIIDIAERMKVLSLNGSIQAAKLGDRGKAFKIVVAEMRALAEQINEIIAGINSRNKQGNPPAATPGPALFHERASAG